MCQRHDLELVPGLFLAGLGVGDEDAVLVEDEEVRLASEDGGVAAELLIAGRSVSLYHSIMALERKAWKGVLALDADVVAALDPPVSVLV